MVFCGKAARKVLTLKSETSEQVTPYMLNAPAETDGSTFTEEVEPEDEDDDFEAWGFREQDKLNIRRSGATPVFNWMRWLL